jgi:Bacterial cell division membrane protein
MANPARYKNDRVYLLLIVANVLFGAIMLASASAPVSLNRYHNTWFYIWHQLYAGIIPGFFFMWILSRIDYHIYKKFSFYIFGAALFLMLLVFVPGISASYGTAKSWLVVAGISFQPTEFLKIAFILYAAALLVGDEKRKPGAAFFPALLVLGLVAITLIAQPDLGSLLLFCAAFVALVVAAGSPLAYVFSVMILGFSSLYAFAKAAPYRAARLTVFLHPELDPQGIGYQINQALLAIGSGGIIGVGLGHSMQKFSYLPEVINDSIYPIIGEELGFIFSAAYIALVVAIFLRGLKIARGASDNYGRLITIGIVSWILCQSFLNIGAMIGILPLTGLPLPFVSYGGTAMIASLSAVGIVLSVSRGTSHN